MNFLSPASFRLLSRSRARRGACLFGRLLTWTGTLVIAQSDAGSVAQAAAAAAGSLAPPTAIPGPSTTVVIVKPDTPTAPALVTPAVTVAPVRRHIADPAWNDTWQGIITARARGPHPARLVNLSVRSTITRGTPPLIGGAVARGPEMLPILVRAIGPGLRQFGVTNALTGPELSIYNGNTLSAQMNTIDAATPAVSAFVGAFPAVPSSSGLANGDAALVGRLAAGALTAHCGSTTNSGVALLEFYDADPNASATSSRFVNFSARGSVGSGEGTLVVGFVVAGEGTITLLLRGVGPTLSFLSSVQMLQDPVIELYAGSTRIAANDNWAPSDAVSRAALLEAQSATGAFALTSDDDAALLVTLPAGTYTLHVRAASGAGNVALAEIYEVATGSFDPAHATNAIGLDLFREVAKNAADQNVVLSPYSIETALALAYAGAAGATRDEMSRVLRLPADNTALQTGFASLRRALELAAEDSTEGARARTALGAPTDPIQWNAANRLFGQRDYPFRDSFVTLMRDGFAAPLATLDFRTQTEAARLAINVWVEEQTREKIKDLIPPGGVGGLTRLVLVNALYLKAPWDKPFPKSATLARAFRLTATTSQNVPTMAATAVLGHATEPGRTVVSLDYLGGGLQFVIVLPDEGLTPEDVAATLTPATVAQWTRLARRQVALYLPKFKVEGGSLSLSTALQALGLRTAFDIPIGSANFDGIAPRDAGPLAISDVFHKTFIALDEEGTEAAAATAVVVATSASIEPPPVEVRVDRPFLFAIQHRATGVCLFLGRIGDPR